MCKTDYEHENTGFTCTCGLLPCVCTSEWSGGSMKAETQFAELYPEPTDEECMCTCGLLPCICANQPPKRGQQRSASRRGGGARGGGGGWGVSP
jgi:hypothetical protein